MKTDTTSQINTTKCFSADEIARERFPDYVEQKLFSACEDSRHEFFTFLLEQARKHPIDNSAYRLLEFQRDKEEAKARNQKL
jgi:hypothetical protein